MSASIATASLAPPYEARDEPALEGGWLERAFDRLGPGWVGAGFVALAFAVYLLSNPHRQDSYNHFVWQADAFLHGRVAIPWVRDEGPNGYFQDVLPLGDRELSARLGVPWQPGYALVPFPPLPAVVLLPFVALFGLATQASMVAVALGALNVGLCWRMLIRVTPGRVPAALGTVFYGFGTVAWYAAMLGSTWFLAHVVASTFLFLGITAALDADRRATLAATLGVTTGWLPRQAWAGLLFGLAALARLTTLLGAPFFVLVGAGGTWLRRGVGAGVGMSVAVALLLGYNLASTGHLFHPAYDWIRDHEYRPRPELYHPEWGTEDPRYILQNAAVMLLWPPLQPRAEDPACAGVEGGGGDLLFDRDCPLLRPDPLGLSMLLVSPAYLLAVPALLLGWRRRVVAGAALATLAIALGDLAHFSQGWVQFGYRFSNDFAPFAVILVAIGIAGAARGRLGTTVAWLLVGASVLVNAWGVWWGVTLGW